MQFKTHTHAVESGKANYLKHFVSHSNIKKPFYSGDALPYVTINCYIRMVKLRKEYEVTLKMVADG